MARNRSQHTPTRRRAREKQGDAIDTLLAALTMAEKRAALSQLGGGPAGRSLKTTEQLDDAIRETGRAESEILEVLRSSETGSPKKHFFFGTVTGDVAAAVRKGSRTINRNVVDDVLLSYISGRPPDAPISLLFERTTTGAAWTQLAGTGGYEEVWGKTTTTLRHAVLVRIDPGSSRIMFNYPGLPPGIDYDYNVPIAAALSALAKLGLRVDPLPIRACITQLIRAKGRRIVPVRGDLITPQGDVKLRSHHGKSSIQELIAHFVKSADDSHTEPALLDLITTNITNHSFEKVGLLWTEERILTRVQFLEAGADVLFVWGTATPSFELVGRMMGLLYDLAAGLASESTETVWTTIVDLPDQTILLPQEFRSRFPLESALVDNVITDAVKLALLVPVYRLRGDPDLLEELGEQEWGTDLLRLRRTFRAGSAEIDGSDANSISVAFRRVRIREAAAR